MAAKDDELARSATRVGKEMSNDEGQRGHLTDDAARTALDRKGSFDEGLKADPAPPGAMKPEDILAMDNLPTDLHEIEKLLGLDIGDKTREEKPPGDMQVHRMNEALENGTATEAPATVAEKPKAVEPPPEKKVEPPAADATATAAAAGTTSDPEFIETRDGKGKIPFAVLKHERQQNAQLNTELIAARAMIEQLRTKPAAGESATSRIEQEQQTQVADEASKGLLTDQDIEALSERFPADLLEVLTKLNASARESVTKIREMEAEAHNLETRDIHQQAETVQEMIDQDPVLTKIQQDPDQWAEAVRIDDTLRSMKRWEGKPQTERFAEVKRMLGYEAEPQKTEPTLTAEQKAAAKLAEAAGKQQQGRAFTHSDLPGGHAPAQDERESAAGMSVMDLANRMEKMSPTQLDRYLATLG